MSTNSDATKGRGSRGVGDFSVALARKIKGLRAENGLSQEELSARAGIPYATYRKLEKGTTVIDVEQQTRIAVALGVDPDDLYDMAVEQARADAERDTYGDDSDEAKFRRLFWAPIGEMTPVERAFVLQMLDRRAGRGASLSVVDDTMPIAAREVDDDVEAEAQQDDA